MNLDKNYIKKTLFLKRKEKIPSAQGGYLDFSPNIKNGYVSVDLDSDFLPEDTYINIFLTKTCEIFEYVDVKKDDKIYTVERQSINPYYIGFDFFNSVNRIKVNTDNDLSFEMINYLNSAYTESIASYSANTSPVITWFNEIGYNILANDITTTIDEVTGLKKEENGLEKLEKISQTLSSVVSKSFYFPISINK